jgi:hypothetical protein
MKKQLLFGIFWLNSILFAQKPDSTVLINYFPNVGKERLMSMNMTPLVTQLVPFNRSNPLISGPYMVNFKRYTNNKAVRYGLGANFRFLSDDLSAQNFNFHVGWERRRRISDRFAMIQGFDTFFSFGGFNFPGSNTTSNDDFFDEFEGGLGFGPVWGFEYALNRNMSISTETAFHIPILSTLGFFLMPPTAINLNYRFFKN